MINLVWALLCRQSIVNADTDNISLIEIFEEIEVPLEEGTGKIFFPIDCDLVVSWLKTNDLNNIDYFVLTLFDPLNEILLKGKRALVFDKQSNKLITIFNFNALPLSSPGIYKFEIVVPVIDKEDEFEKVGSTSLQVNYLPRNPLLDDEDS